MFSTPLFIDPISLTLIGIIAAIYYGYKYLSRGLHNARANFGGPLQSGKVYNTPNRYGPPEGMTPEQQQQLHQQQYGSQGQRWVLPGTSGNQNTVTGMSPTTQNLLMTVATKALGSSLGSLRFALGVITFLAPHVKSTQSFQRWQQWANQQFNPEVESEASQVQNKANNAAQQMNQQQQSSSSSTDASLRQRNTGGVPPPSYGESWQHQSQPTGQVGAAGKAF